MVKVLFIFGTRPEAIKMAPVVKELERYPDKIVSQVCVTAQHREMLDQVLNLFDIVPDYDLDLMRPNQSLAALTARIFTKLDAVLAQEQPDWVLVQGDTTTVIAASLMAFYHQVKVDHVEALQEITERPKVVDAGTVKLGGRARTAQTSWRSPGKRSRSKGV